MKYAYIKEQRNNHSVLMLCKTLGVSRSGYYHWSKREVSVRQRANLQIVQQMRQIHADVKRTYGSPRMHAELVGRGHLISRGRVERLMRKHGIQAKQARRYKRVYEHRQVQQPHPNLLDRQFYAKSPNQKWVSDITIIDTRQGWLYLAIVLDLYSRAIVGWSMSSKITGQLVRDALQMATTQRENVQGVLVHSDQGSQYTAGDYQAELSRHAMICSMSRKGECHDNAVAESFFHTLKAELVRDQRFTTRDAARQAIFRYIELFYNRKRRHSYLNYQAPLEYERMGNAA